VVVFKPILHPYSRFLLVGNDATLETVATRPRGEGKACDNNTMRMPNRRKVTALEQGARNCAGVGTWRGWIGFIFSLSSPLSGLTASFEAPAKACHPGLFTGIGRKEPALIQASQPNAFVSKYDKPDSCGGAGRISSSTFCLLILLLVHILPRCPAIY
jgi:hypothetical protein